MNSRVKTLFGPIVLGLAILLSKPSLTRADEWGWDQLKTEKIDIQPFSSGQGDVLTTYPSFLQALIHRVLRWDPKKELNNSTGWAYPGRELMRNLSVQFDVTDTEHFRKVWFTLRPGLKVRGLFGIHDFKTPRPFIILRMGIHGNVDELFAERFIAGAAYEDLNANILVLENLTSHAFLSQNKDITFGGTEEGLHTFLILNELKNEKYRLHSLIKSVHLIGVSLGGQGTFITALLDSHNQRMIKSVLNMCPLINLKTTFAFHAQPSLKNVAIDYWNAVRMQTLFNKYPDQLLYRDLFKMPFDLTPRFTPKVMAILEKDRHAPLLSPEELNRQVPGLVWPPGLMQLLTRSTSFYELNEFWRLFRDVKTPFMIYTSPNDAFVINNLNSEMIFAGKQPGDFKNVKYERLERGVHCGLAPVYDWSRVVEMLQVGLGLPKL